MAKYPKKKAGRDGCDECGCWWLQGVEATRRRAMSAETILTRLEQGEIVVTTPSEWEAVASAFEVLEEHDTQMAGMLWILRGPSGLVALEEPKRTERVLRPLHDPDQVRAFVDDRLATYERMWDGCGCRVEYYR